MKSRKKCRSCGSYFRPDKINCHFQVYCKRAECREASHKASKAKSRRKYSIDLEFRRKESERVKRWQSKNPDYWKNRKNNSKKVSKDVVLRDITQVEKLQEDLSVLRDITFCQHTMLEGVISILTGEVLRDNIGVQRSRLYDRGKEVSGIETETDIINKIKQMRLRYETQSISRSPPEA